MNSPDLSRRDFLRLGAAGAASAKLIVPRVRAATAVPEAGKAPAFRPYITPDDQFIDVSRGNPPPHQLPQAGLAEAGLTAETWRLEITADPFVEYPHTKIPATLSKPHTIADGTALDLPALMELGRKHEVHYFKAMQCLNIEAPLGQGVWTGVPLRELLRQCGRMLAVRRIYYWGFHYDDPKQIFKSSLSYTQAMETPPGALPAFVAYKLNGRPIPPERGGPVRLVVPWSCGYKSMKWLQHIFVTSDPRNWDTYSEANNDPDSYQKTAAYVDKGPEKISAGDPVYLTGQVVSGLSGVRRVEYWVRPVSGETGRLEDDDPELLRGPWTPCELQTPPDWPRVLPAGLKPNQLLGFDRITGQPLTWPLPYSITQYFAVIRGLKPGRYELRARSVDLNDIAQPEPRPIQKTGRNGIQVRRLEVA